jgi:hypothetical protein
MEKHIEGHGGRRHVEQFRHYHEMPRAGHGEKLREPLNYAEKYSLPRRHVFHASESASRPAIAAALQRKGPITDRHRNGCENT